MMYQTEFTGWADLSLEDMVVAYRKAKADCFFENTFPAAIKFAEYEQDLYSNLEKLFLKLTENKGFAEDDELIGEYRLLPKKLTLESKKRKSHGHIHFSSTERAFDDLINNNKLIPEFRIVADFPVDAHIISALWINTLGYKFDASLDESCYGARLKRIKNDESLDKNAEKPFHISAVGSFNPYFQPYQNWRNDGLNAIRGELDKERDVIAASLDLKTYYHSIDPMALTSNELHRELGLSLSDEELAFTEELASFMKKWADGASKFAEDLIQQSSKSKKVPGGLVIGLTASRIFSNVLLSKWDRLIKEKLSPIHYGRYVDDMFIVMHDTKCVKNTHDFMRLLQERIGCEYLFQVDQKVKNKESSLWQIHQGEALQRDSKIELHSNKQKLFILHGQAGLDLLDSIEKEISELSSEHRLMPSPDRLDDSTAARVLSAAATVGEEADTLRRADGLTIRRLSWSLQLRHVESLARDLPPREWETQRKEFYQFAQNHILRPDNLFEHFVYLPRLLGFAISLSEWVEAEKIVISSYLALEVLEGNVGKGKDVAINGQKVKCGKSLWRTLRGTLSWIFIDSAARNYDPDKLLSEKINRNEKRLSSLFLDGILRELSTFEDVVNFNFGEEEFNIKAPLVAKADLAKEPYKRIMSSDSASSLLNQPNGKRERKIRKLMDSSGLINLDVLAQFLSSSRTLRLASVKEGNRKGESQFPYLFPTRPLTPGEIAELAPECVGLPDDNGKPFPEKPSIIWAKYVRAIRGVWTKPTLSATDQEAPKKKKIPKNLYIGTKSKNKIVVALTNLKTGDNDWAATASKKPNLSLERYQRISELVNQTIKLKPKPDYVLFPELSIPLQWVSSIAARLAASGVSLIAGTEYRHFEKNELVSEAYLCLTDNRLGFPTTVIIKQPKVEPAVREDKFLTAKFGKKWAYSKIRPYKNKPIYIHNGIHFGVMVCSELTNTKSRLRMQGDIDALMILSWNRDLETFSALVESAALDLHAYMILVNNRKYGDSRVRSPSQKSFLRDVARIRGGENDFVIVATLDVNELRAFQSRSKRWPLPGDKFKPLPEGYRLAKKRRKLPPR